MTQRLTFEELAGLTIKAVIPDERHVLFVFTDDTFAVVVAEEPEWQGCMPSCICDGQFKADELPWLFGKQQVIDLGVVTKAELTAARKKQAASDARQLRQAELKQLEYLKNKYEKGKKA